MVTRRQRVVNLTDDETDAALATFIADVVELGGLFRRLADDIAKLEGHTQTVWYALSVFSAGSVTVAQGARRLGTTRQALQRTANDLLRQGLASAEPNPDHRSSPLIVLTPRGTQTLTRISAAAAQARQQWFSNQDATALSSAHAEIRRLRDALRETAQNASPE